MPARPSGSAGSSKRRRRPFPRGLGMSDLPHVTRLRHDTKRRRLTVARVDRLAPKMVRVVLPGEDLPGFTSLGFDDHVHLFSTETAIRDFPPRRYDAGAGELWIDFYL